MCIGRIQKLHAGELCCFGCGYAVAVLLGLISKIATTPTPRQQVNRRPAIFRNVCSCPTQIFLCAHLLFLSLLNIHFFSYNRIYPNLPLFTFFSPTLTTYTDTKAVRRGALLFWVWLCCCCPAWVN